VIKRKSAGELILKRLLSIGGIRKAKAQNNILEKISGKYSLKGKIRGKSKF
jgi:hypothetical protein